LLVESLNGNRENISECCSVGVCEVIAAFTSLQLLLEFDQRGLAPRRERRAVN
jgi:hypothetical protein